MTTHTKRQVALELSSAGKKDLQVGPLKLKQL